MIPTSKKNDVLRSLAQLIRQNQSEIIEANKKDVLAYHGTDDSMLDRLKVDEGKVASMVSAVNDALHLNDPEDKLLYEHHHENGMRIENRTVPFGNILIIYESRPDVTVEAAITAFKAGNKILLKGGKEARNTNLLLTELWHQALEKNEVSKAYVIYLDLIREATQNLIKKNTHDVDLIIPRGGEGLINFVKQNTDIPVIVSGRGNNFLFIDEFADSEMACEIMLNGKKRISVCNALDKVLIHQDIPDYHEFVSHLIKSLQKKDIEILGDHEISSHHIEAAPINSEDVLYEEFLSSKIMLIAVGSINEAIYAINRYSGGHSAAIVTRDIERAAKFLNEVDCASVLHNASTRFTDGGQFGFGAEMAISTQKVHFRGPIGIDQLVTNKWFVHGTGQTRP